MKAVLRGKLRAPSAPKKQLERPYSRSLTANLEALELKEEISPKRIREQEIIELRAKINQVETKRTIQRINQLRSWFFEKINKIDQPLPRLTRGHRDSILIKKVRHEKGDITTEPEENQKTPSVPSTKECTQQNWKTWTKWTNFWTDTRYQS